MWQPIDERTRVCHCCRLQQFFIRCVWLSDQEIFADRAVKQKAFLRHHPYLPPQRGNADFSNRSSIDQDLSAIRFIETREKIDHCGFTCPSRANKGHHFPRSRMKRDVIQRRQFPGITETDVSKLNLPAHWLNECCASFRLSR